MQDLKKKNYNTYLIQLILAFIVYITVVLLDRFYLVHLHEKEI